MAKNLNVNLTFKADSSQAKSQIVELQGLLNKIALGTDIKINGAQAAQQISQASAAAKELALHLNNAYNATTGNFDLSKLSRSLNKAGTDINTLSSKLLAIGPTGQQAFVKLAQSIATADRPMVTMNARLTELWTTMKNTARWQLTSSMLHGFMGAIQTAYGYTKDLNESLNNIRIVSGQSVEQMANFAKEANKAAKALSASTLDYTNAALIYYQQGLSNQEVQERTDVTVKMANVSRQSAEEVSDQMTAIWNNFDDGSKSLEYYGDVITALGAATASSSEEIATGLEKFAAVAETVGLSYEYATAALATVTATTRQSADVVGTAFKTLFARIQDLELGETLDDGVTLGKYSAALNAVGISIMNQQGQLKDMNDILDDMGNKWDTLSKAQQVSLAQTVAGTRQYTQLIALMDNWSFFQENLSTAEGSSGELEKQAEIYAESWEAADKRVKASAEAIYEAILDDDFFIGITDGFSGFLDSIKAFIDGLGGIKPLIAGIGSMLLGAFSGRVVESLNNLKSNLLVTFQGAQKQADILATKMNAKVSEALSQSDNSQVGSINKLNLSMETALRNTQSLNEAKSAFLLVEKNLTAAERQEAETTLHLIEQYQQERQAIADLIVQLEQEQDLQLREASEEASGYMGKFDITSQFAPNLKGDDLAQFELYLQNSNEAVSKLIPNLIEAAAAKKEFSLSGDVGVKIFKEELNSLNEFSNRLKTVGTDNVAFEKLRGDVYRFAQTLNEATGGALPQLKNALKDLANIEDPVVLQERIDQMAKALTSSTIPANQLRTALRNMGVEEKTINKLIARTQQLTGANQKLKQSQDRVNQAVKDFKPTHQITMMERMVKGAAGLGQTAMLMTSFKSALSAINNEDLSWGEKLSTIFMSISMMVPAALGAIKSFDTVLGLNIAQTYGAVIANAQYTRTIKDQISQTSMSTIVKRINNGEDKNAILNGIAKSAVKKGLIKEEEKEGYIIALNNQLKKQGANIEKMSIAKGLAKTIQKKLETKATVLNTAAQAGETSGVWASVVAWIAKQAAMAPVLVVTLLIVAAITALALIIWGAVSAIKAITEAYNADAIAAEKANNAVKELTTSYENLKTAVEDFKSTAKDYDEAVAALAELDRGTKEYEEALEKANEQARKLIETYGLWDDYTIQNGLISINANALENAELALEADTRESQKALISAKIFANQANLNNEATNLARNNLNNIAGNANGQAYSRDLWSGEVQAIGKAMDTVRDKMNGITPSLDDLKTYLRENGIELGLNSDIIRNLDVILNNETINTLWDFADSMEEARQANIYYAEQILGLITEGKYANAISSLANGDKALEQLLTAAATGITTKSEEELERISQNTQKNYGYIGVISTKNDSGDNIENYVKNTLLKQSDIFKDINLTDIYSQIFKGRSYDGDINTEEMLRDYAAAEGWTLTSVQDKNGKIIIEGTDINGQALQTTEYDNDVIQEMWSKAIYDFISAAEIEKTIMSEEEFKSITSSILNNSSDKYGVDWGTQILQGLSSNNKIDLNDVFAEIDPNEIESLKNLSDEQIIALFGLSKEQQEMLGPNIINSLVSSTRDSLEQWTKESYTSGANIEGENTAEAIGLDVEEFKAYRDILIKTNDEYKTNIKGANEVAKSNMRLQKGVDTLSEDWEDYVAIMNSATASDIEKAKVAAAMREGLQDILNLDASQFELLPSDFGVKHWDAIQKVMNGVEGAVDDLRDLAGQEILLSITGKVSFDELDADLIALHNRILNLDMEDLKVGIALDPKDQEAFYAACNELIASGKMTATEVQTYLASMGFDSEIVHTPHQHPVERQYWDGGQFQTMTAYETTYTDAIKIITPNGSYGGDTNVLTTATPGASEAAKRDKNDRPIRGTDDRYKEIEDQLDNIQETMTNINREMDLSYGRGRIAAINKLVNALEKENKVLAEQRQLAANYQVVDRKNLDAIMAEGTSEYGITAKLQYNEDGDLVNWDAYWDEVYTKYQQMYDTAGDTALEDFEAWLEKAEQFAEEYIESTEKLEEVTQKIKDNIADQMSQRFTAWAEDVELEAELTDESIEHLEHALERFADDFYARSEALTLIYDNLPEIFNTENKNNLDTSMADLYNKHYIEKDDYGNPLISQADFIKGMKLIQEQAENTSNSIIGYISTFKEYYADTINEGLELFNAEMDHLDNLNKVVDHYKNINEILNGTVDYDTLQAMFNTKKSIVLGQIEAAQMNLEKANAEVDEKRTEMNNARDAMENAKNTFGEDSEEYKIAKTQYDIVKAEFDAVYAAAEEIESVLLESAEEYANIIREEFTANFEKFSEDFERALGDGKVFDEINESLERTKALTEEWLTDTNKIYETNKLMNTAQQALDKTTNTVAKNKLSAFIKETKQLQNQSKLSNFELEVQQKKYDLLLAEIALEEAQNAKSTVRLQRDSEGNFGYVYTADAEAIAKAEQDYAAADNELYNLRLEGANEFTEKRIQLDQKLHDDLANLADLYYNQGVIDEEEFNRRKDEILNAYYQQVQDYAYLYNVAVRDDSRVTADAWSTDYADMVTDTESWKTDVNKYLGDIKNAWGEYQTEVDKLNGYIYDSNEEVTDSEEALRKKLTEVEAAGNNLAKSLKETVTPEIWNEINAVDTLTTKFQNELLPDLAELVTAYDEAAAAARDYWMAATQEEGTTIKTPEVKGDGKPTYKPSEVEDDGGPPTTEEPKTKNRQPTGYAYGYNGQIYGGFQTARQAALAAFEANGLLTSHVKGYDEEGYLDDQNYNIIMSKDSTIPSGTNYSFASEITPVKIKGIDYIQLPDGQWTTLEAFKWCTVKLGEGLLKHYQTTYDIPAFVPNIEWFNTGGYTGNWGPEGKLAMLHQKELVLNAHDTENMLAAITIVRDLMNSVDLSIAQLSSGLITPSIMSLDNQLLEQSVHIEASFPSVQDRYEIEEAFNNLVNTASQFANRKRL